MAEITAAGYLNVTAVGYMMQGEGTSTIMFFIAALVVVLIIVVAWQLIKKKRAIYTYAYRQKK